MLNTLVPETEIFKKCRVDCSLSVIYQKMYFEIGFASEHFSLLELHIGFCLYLWPTAPNW